MLLMATSARAGTPDALEARIRAQRADNEIRNDEAKLRYRHHILKVVRLWQNAVRVSEGPGRLDAMKGEADAWALLAHWSGRTDDDRRARRARAAVRRAGRAGRAEAETADRPRSARVPPADEERRERPMGSETRPRAILVSHGPVDIIGPPPTVPPMQELQRLLDQTRTQTEGTGDATDVVCGPHPDQPHLVRTIVIDPGHGGEEEGARNIDGVCEKDVNLAIALELERRLRGFCIVMTRRSDTDVSLADRVRIANDAEADLFVSVHVNGSSHREFSGVETYVLATDARRYAGRLEDREHRQHGVGPQLNRDPRWEQDVRLLLADLAMRNATREALSLAETVQASVVRRLSVPVPVKDLGVKSELFYVLLGARMPSILVEAGFMTHPVEGRRLARPKVQGQIARGIADGIREYVVRRHHALERPVVAQVD